MAGSPNMGKVREPAVIVGGVLKCPGCGWTDNLWHAEAVLVGRRLIRSAVVGATLVFEGAYEVFDSDGVDERLLCRDCGREWDLPEGMDVDFR